MTMDYGWGYDLVPNSSNSMGLESFDQGPQGPPPTPNFFKPVNITVENGLYYATIYVCKALDETPASQSLGIWFSSLKDTDQVHLTISSLVLDLPLQSIINLMSAVASTRAKVIVHLDTIVTDSLAYFYLLASTVKRGSEGGLFIPSYVLQRDQDTSGPWKAVHDFFKWIVETAVSKDLLTKEEADRLHRGSHVIIPGDRFQ